jgi:hypothetical protein
MGMNLIFVLLVVVAIVIFCVLYSRFSAREFEHKETLAALEKGVDLPVRQSAPWTPRTYLLHGMIWLFAGFTSMAALFSIAITSNRPPSVEMKLRSVNNARASGAKPEEIQMLLNDTRSDQSVPMGLGMLGLVPMGVGLAYLIFYRVESKKLLS